VRLLLEPFRDAVVRLVKAFPDLVCLLPTVPHVAAVVRAGTANWPAPLHVLEGDADKFSAFNAANAALAASGTVTTELALAHTPMVVAYRFGWLTYALGKPFVSVKFATLVNIILDREAVPEFIQSRCTGTNLANALAPLLRDTPERRKQIQELDAATAELGIGSELPSLRAARALLDFVRTSRESS
jgi:lipid-A-disaccharide synthase